MDKIIKKIIEKMYSIRINKQEKQLINKHKEWINLTKEEKKKLNKENLKVSKIMKNLYIHWNDCDYSKFVSDSYYQIKLLPKLNSINYGVLGIRHKKSYSSDKNYEEKILSDIKFPKTIIRCIDGDYYDEYYNIISIEQAIMLINQYPKLVFKQSIGLGHGKGVKLVNQENYKEELYNFGQNYIVQEVLIQNAILSNFNFSSVNIIRITSLYWKGKVYILSGILRVGAPGAFCDHLGYENNNPRIIALDTEGNLTGNAIDPNEGIIYDDVYGKKIEGTIPSYNIMKEIVIKKHKQLAHHKIIGWDFTIDNKNNVTCIEYNNTVPGIVQSQMACGPIFALKTERGKTLLEEIIENK